MTITLGLLNPTAVSTEIEVTSIGHDRMVNSCCCKTTTKNLREVIKVIGVRTISKAKEKEEIEH